MTSINFQDTNTLLILLGLVLIGVLLGVIFERWQGRKRLREIEAQAQLNLQQVQQNYDDQLFQADSRLKQQEQDIEKLREEQLASHRRAGELEQMKEQVADLQREKQQWQERYQLVNRQLSEMTAQMQSQAAKYQQEQVAFKEKISMLEKAEERLQSSFENTANKIFEQSNEKFGKSSKANLDALLSPLKDQIEGFKKQVTDQYVKEGQERASLKTEILGLKELNQQITAEAAALTRALKGDNKKQGNWGEVVLERILKESGLREGHEFETQVSLKSQAGKAYQPDVIVHLPNDKDIVIDSKMSLAAYERYFNEQEDESLRKMHLQEHIQSVRSHIKELGKKDYQDLKGIRTLDYVLMFIPVESAFLLAIDSEPQLVQLALDNNIMLVSPTNLLVALRTVNNIWQYEYQNQNAQDIAQRAAKLYDKFHGFISDMEKIGRSLETTQKSYDLAMNKLASGKGNIVRQVEQFRAQGVQTTKKLDSQLLEKAQLEDGE